MKICLHIILLLVFLGVSSAKAESVAQEDHFSFIKRTLVAWENSGYDGLKNELENIEPVAGLPENSVLDYLLFSGIDLKLQKLDELKAQVDILHADGIYGDVARDSLSDYVQGNKNMTAIIKNIVGVVDAQGETLDDVLTSEIKEYEYEEALDSISVAIIPSELQFFILRMDVIEIVKTISEQFLNSEINDFPTDSARKLKSDVASISDIELVEHVMKRYYNTRLAQNVVKVENAGIVYVTVSLNISLGFGVTTLVGSNDIEFMKEVYTSKTYPTSGMTYEVAEEIAPGWVLLHISLLP